jgi:hypothetical protein
MSAGVADDELVAVGRRLGDAQRAGGSAGEATFSMMICWPRSSPMGGARMRPTTSIGPPAGNGTTMVRVRAGHSCAAAGAQAGTNASAAAMSLLTIVHLPLRTPYASMCVRQSACGACINPRSPRSP